MTRRRVRRLGPLLVIVEAGQLTLALVVGRAWLRVRIDGGDRKRRPRRGPYDA